MINRLPFALAIFSIVGGVFISILFGVNEDMFKTKINDGLARNVKIQQIADPSLKEEKIKTEAEKNWRYYQRYHFHATGIGAMMMGILLFLGQLRAPRKLKIVSAYLVALGGTFYPFVWLFAGIYGPEMGRSEAKEAFAIFGYMGGLFLVGGFITLVASLKFDNENGLRKMSQ